MRLLRSPANMAGCINEKKQDFHHPLLMNFVIE